MRKNDKKPLPPSGRDRIVRARIMRERESRAEAEAKRFAQDRGLTDFLRMVLRAHNASVRVSKRAGARGVCGRKFSTKMPPEGVFEGVLR